MKVGAEQKCLPSRPDSDIAGLFLMKCLQCICLNMRVYEGSEGPVSFRGTYLRLQYKPWPSLASQCAQNAHKGLHSCEAEEHERESIACVRACTPPDIDMKAAAGCQCVNK